MALAAIVALGLVLPLPTIQRDEWGVPNVIAATEAEGFKGLGYAVAQDRLWQMELSRRLSRGTMSEVLGQAYVAADRETLKTGYTDAELQSQFNSLPANLREGYAAYAEGVNERIASLPLPEGYAANGFTPAPWTVLDSVAININLLQRFGRGGAGELRNLLLLKYAETKPKLKARKFDFFDDFVFTDSSGSIPTLIPSDDRNPRTPFPKWTRKDTERQYAALPPLGLLDLAGAVKVASRADTQLIAERVSAPFHTGSYAVVVSPRLSQTGHPLLLSGPQMGFSNPSVVHQIRMETPTLSFEGMDVPGIPGVLVGTTPNVSWGLTTGVADTEDMVVVRDLSKVTRTVRTLRTKGKADELIERLTVGSDPVVLKRDTFAIVQKSAFRGNELQSTVSLNSAWRARTGSEFDLALQNASLNFNAFWATRDGHIGWRYCGHYPIRQSGVDPRLPIEESQTWTGFATAAQMPHVIDPASGILFNWNNKPTAWWPNSDTPAWGAIFRNSELKAALGAAPYNIQRLERAAWQIARTDETWPYFAPFAKADPNLAAFDGWLLDGSEVAPYYRAWLDRLRRDLFVDTTGDFLGESNFRLVTQPSVILRALQGKTKLDYRGKRNVPGLASSALARDLYRPYQSGRIPSPDQIPVPYSNRGTYIQLVQLSPGGITGRNVAPPGTRESGDHVSDQANLARTWTYRPMLGWK